MAAQPSSTAAAPVTEERRPPKKFVLSASAVGLVLLGLAGLLLAESMKVDPTKWPAAVDYIPVAAVMASWIYYVQRPKTASQMRWNCAHLIGLTTALVLIAYLVKPNQITIVLIYWMLAVVTTAGAPLLIALAIIVAHQWVCAKAAAEVSA